MTDFKPAKFFKEVKQEGQKIVWPTRKETLITTAMVFVMVVIFSLEKKVYQTIFRTF